jgi:hypothetical protein
MKKFVVLAMMAALLMAGSAFATTKTIAPNATFPFGNAGIASGPATTNNDDSCDISVAPAATLLLPYFEVDFKSPATTARTTLFTITNTSPYPQIAHVVVWTDWSYAALDFNIWLTGYDVQSINLYDIFNRGVIAPVSASLAGTSFQPGGTTGLSPVGTNPPNQPDATPFGDSANPNHNHSGSLADVSAACVNLPGTLLQQYLLDLQLIFTTGTGGVIIGAGCTGKIGGVHANAIGYITVDVDSTCSTSFPGPLATGGTYSNTEILYDNVLIGDYQDVNPNAATGNYAGGNPMVHIRAVPEGGPAGSNPGTNLPYTFYDRYNTGGAFGSGSATSLTSGPNRLADRRQPLPNTFAARYIEGGATGFNTNYKIWREGITGPSATACGTAAGTANVFQNSTLLLPEVVRFDEHENSNAVAPIGQISPPPPSVTNVLPETSSTSTTSGKYPGTTGSGDVAGWMFLNLDNRNTGANINVYSDPSLNNAAAHPTFTRALRASQNWVIIAMFAEGRYSVDFDAAHLGNGCTPVTATGAPIQPAGGVFVCPTTGTPLCTIVGGVYTNTAPGAGAPTTGTAGTNVTP